MIKVSGLLLIALFFFSCKNRSTSILKHEEGQFCTEKPDIVQWYDTDYENEDYLLSNPLATQQILPEYFPRDHEITKRLQYWIDLMFDEAKKKSKNLGHDMTVLDTMPHPKIKVTKNLINNAWANQVEVCVNANIILDQNGTETKKVKSITYIAAMNEFFFGDLDCHEIDDFTKEQLVNWFNCKGLACHMKLENGTIILEGGCKFHNLIEPSTNYLSNRLGWMPFSNIISVGSGLLKFMKTEENAISVVAHELGHVIKGHSTSSDIGYNFFYRQSGRDNLNQKPEPAPEMDIFANEVKKLANGNGSFLVPESKYHTKLFHHFNDLAKEPHDKLCLNNNCLKSCVALKVLRDSGEVKNFFSNYVDTYPEEGGRIPFPGAPIPKNEYALYYKMENVLAECANMIEIERIASVSNIYYSFLKSESEDFIGSNEDNFKNFIFDVKYLGNYLNKISELSYKNMQEARKIISEATEKGFAFYTAEQEADEVSAEFLGLVGIDPKIIIPLTLKAGRLRWELGHTNPDLDIDPETCEKYFKNDWKDENGKPVFIPIGSLLDLHHGSCYRAFNIWRELHGHKYEINKIDNNQITSKPWKELVDSLGTPN